LLCNAEIAFLAVVGPGSGYAVTFDFPIDNVMNGPAVGLGIELNRDGAGVGLEQGLADVQ
jgi:hypothetical protein